MNVVRCLSDGARGTLWYPCQQSRVDFTLLLGIEDTRAHGVSVWCVCLGATLFRAVKSTTRLGSPLLLAVIIMRWHHVTGSFTGTFSNTPSLQSLSKPLFTSSFQWSGTRGGVCTATGTASSLIKMRNGGDFCIRGSGCFSQRLNAELENLSSMYCFKTGRFSSVGGHGKTIGVDGGIVRLGHGHGESSGPGTPVFEQGFDLPSPTEHKPAVEGASQDATVGKLAGTSPRSIHALNERYGTLTCLDT